MSRYFLVHISLIIFSLAVRAEDVCLEWFKNSKIQSSSSNCLGKCNVLLTDMATFACHNECGNYCKPLKCKIDSYWKAKVKNNRPTKWEISLEESSLWSEKEKKELVKVLSRLPESLKSIPFDGFYRMKKSIDIGNPATTSMSGQSVIIYDSAFDNSFWSLAEVVAHELGHVIYLSLKKSERQNYEDSLGWKRKLSPGSVRSGEFVSSRAKDNVDEDFAENIKFILMNPNELKSKVPKAYNWIFKNISKYFKLKEECKNE